MAEKTRDILTQIYSRHLATISQNSFTFREIEVIACLIHTRGIKKVALLLNIAPKTVETHIRNINLKINCNSQEGIINFIEKSEKLGIIREFYNHIIQPATQSTNEEVTSQHTNDEVKENLPQNCLAPMPMETDFIFKDLKNSVSWIYSKSSKMIFVCALLIVLSLCFVFFIYPFYNNNKDKLSVRSDLIVPMNAVLLERSDFLTQIDQKFKKGPGIQSLALIGPGGVGKTTLARLYARSQSVPVIWEINADTHENLIRSFEGLAYALSKTEQDKKTFRDLQDINNTKQREESLLLFIKEQLKQHGDWLLIYDNMAKYTDIHHYLPQDVATWGQGKVILTTQNINFQNNKNINHCIFVDSLTNQQKLYLFTKIIGDDKTRPNESTQNKESGENKKFLESIPPFPLDVSIAAYYLKSTNISRENYVKNLNKYDENFISAQENILKDSGEYIKTRYNIVTLSIQQLIENNEKFRDLFLFVSLLDAQDIPRKLLEEFAGESIVDDFIYNLKKYSLIVENSVSSTLVGPSFSMHRSTQDIALAYLTKKINSEEYAQFIKPMFKVLESYTFKTINQKNYREAELLASHCEVFLRHDLLSLKMMGSLYTLLGHIYLYLGDYNKAQEALQKSLARLTTDKDKNYAQISHTLALLGTVYRRLGSYDKAKNFLEQAMINSEKIQPYNQISSAQILIHLGNVYRELGHYEKAKNLLEQSMEIYEKHNPKDQIGIAYILIYLGNIYRELGDFEKAKNLLERSLTINKEHFPEDNLEIAWVLVSLGNVYRELSNYEKAKDLLERSLVIYRKHLSENHVYVTWALLTLGNIYKDSRDYGKARNLLEKSLITYENRFGKCHVQIARILRSLGQLNFSEGQLKIAEDFLNKALGIFQQNNHPDSYMIFEDLALLYKKKSELTPLQRPQTQNLKNQSIHYLKQSLAVAQKYFLEDSPHIFRIQSKLMKLEQTIP